jgi:hypothetical protein
MEESMSAIASAYKLSGSEVQQAKMFLDQNDAKGFWRFMMEHEMMTFPYTGDVLGAVIPFLRERGIALPKPGPALLDGVRGVVVAGRAADFQGVSLGLSQLEVSDGALREYYRELYEHDWEEAALAMREGFAFIQRAIAAINEEDEMAVLSIV